MTTRVMTDPRRHQRDYDDDEKPKAEREPPGPRVEKDRIINQNGVHRLTTATAHIPSVSSIASSTKTNHHARTKNKVCRSNRYHVLCL